MRAAVPGKPAEGPGAQSKHRAPCLVLSASVLSTCERGSAFAIGIPVVALLANLDTEAGAKPAVIASGPEAGTLMTSSLTYKNCSEAYINASSSKLRCLSLISPASNQLPRARILCYQHNRDFTVDFTACVEKVEGELGCRQALLGIPKLPWNHSFLVPSNAYFKWFFCSPFPHERALANLQMNFESSFDTRSVSYAFMIDRELYVFSFQF